MVVRELLYLALIAPSTEHVLADVRPGVARHGANAGLALVVTHHLQPLQLLQDVGGDAVLCRGAPAGHRGEEAGEVLLVHGETDGGVDGEVGRLRQSHQGDVVAAPRWVIVAGSLHDLIHVEILHNQRLVNSIELVLSQSDLQSPWTEIRNLFRN